METWTKHCLHEFVVNVCADILQFMFQPLVTHHSGSTAAAAVGGRGCVLGPCLTTVSRGGKTAARPKGSNPCTCCAG